MSITEHAPPLVPQTTKPKPPKKEWTTTELAEVKKLMGTITVPEIAKKLGVTPSSIYNVANVQGIKSDPAKLRTKYDYGQIKKLIMRGKSTTEISEIIGCNARHVRWIAANKLSEGFARQLKRNGRKNMRTKNNNKQ